MGCDIHVRVERRNKKGEYKHIHGFAPFSNRDYGTFGFLAGVRNYSNIPPICELRGFPCDASKSVEQDYIGWGDDAHSSSWISVEELLGFDYDKQIEDCRVTRMTQYGLDGGCTCEKGDGRLTTYRDFLGPYFFKDLEYLSKKHAHRIVFWFDN